MTNQLKLVAKSYDRGIDFGREGVDLYKALPEHITSDPDFAIYQEMVKHGVLAGSGCKEIRDYLSPDTGMKFIDLGCCLNLMLNDYDQRDSKYYGVDISSKTIQLLNEFVSRKNISIGALFCGSIHETPFHANYFDIGACIGVLEYFNKDFVEKAIMEAHRIIKPYGKFVLDIPNLGNPTFRIMMLIEEYLGRPDRFDMSSQEFEDMLLKYFEVEKTDKVDAGAMLRYFLSCKK